MPVLLLLRATPIELSYSGVHGLDPFVRIVHNPVLDGAVVGIEGGSYDSSRFDEQENKRPYAGSSVA